jgi:hypothetical protein
MPGPKQRRRAETAIETSRRDGGMPPGAMRSRSPSEMPAGAMSSRRPSEMPRGEMRRPRAAGMPPGDMRGNGPENAAGRMSGAGAGPSSMPSGSMRSATKTERCTGCGDADDPAD